MTVFCNVLLKTWVVRSLPTAIYQNNLYSQTGSPADARLGLIHCRRPSNHYCLQKAFEPEHVFVYVSISNFTHVLQDKYGLQNPAANTRNHGLVQRRTVPEAAPHSGAFSLRREPSKVRQAEICQLDHGQAGIRQSSSQFVV